MVLTPPILFAEAVAVYLLLTYVPGASGAHEPGRLPAAIFMFTFEAARMFFCLFSDLPPKEVALIQS